MRMYKFFLGVHENVPKDFWGVMRMYKFFLGMYENVPKDFGGLWEW